MDKIAIGFWVAIVLIFIVIWITVTPALIMYNYNKKHENDKITYTKAYSKLFDKESGMSHFYALLIAIVPIAIIGFIVGGRIDDKNEKKKNDANKCLKDANEDPEKIKVCLKDL